MLLQYFDISVTSEIFLERCLPKQDIRARWGCRYDPNPSEYYAGDLTSETGGFGCFAPVLERSIRLMFARQGINGLKMKDISGISLEEIASQYLNQGIPVAVWLTNDMEPLRGFYQWQSFDKTQTYLYPIAEHCLVLTGYDEESYYFNDPYESRGRVSYPKEKVEQRYYELGKQAIVVTELSE